MNSIKMQKDMTLKDELPRLVGAQYATGEEWGNSSRRNEEIHSFPLSQSGNSAQVWICLLVILKSDARKKNFAQESGMLGP